jgi:hypothetical protein
MTRKKKNDWSRREFLWDVISGMTAYNLTPMILGSLIPRPASAANRRRHLIALCDGGGWDSLWYHNFCTSPEAVGERIFGYNTRYGETDLGQFPDSLRTPLGPLMRPWTTGELSDLLIWRGMIKEGCHSVSNRNLHAGNSTLGLSGYSPLVARATALEDYVRNFHYVQIANTAKDLNMYPGPLQGPALASMISDQAGWAKTTSGSGTTADTARQALVDKAVGDLGNLAFSPLLALNSNKAMIAEFLRSYSSASSSSGSNHGTSLEFRQTWKRYFLAILDGFRYLASNEPSKKFVVAAGSNSMLNGLGSIQITTSLATPDDVVNPTPANLALTPFRRARDYAWRFALAEYLVVKDLSAVVDFQPSNGDYHFTFVDDFINRSVGYFGMRELIRGLKAVPMANGKTLLDHTTIVFTSDFDRDPKFAGGGTNHGNTCSAIFAGMGVANGKVLGGQKRGYNSPAGPFNGNLGRPCKVDADGLPSTGGSFIHAKSVFPTVLSIFDVPIPAAQQNEWKAFAPVINLAKKIA